MGLGDVKMALMIGLALGKYVGVALFAAFSLSLVPSLGLLLVKGLRARKIGFPFGPFLAFGAVVALMWGPAIWNWYIARVARPRRLGSLAGCRSPTSRPANRTGQA